MQRATLTKRLDLNWKCVVLSAVKFGTAWFTDVSCYLQCKTVGSYTFAQIYCFVLRTRARNRFRLCVRDKIRHLQIPTVKVELQCK